MNEQLIRQIVEDVREACEQVCQKNADDWRESAMRLTPGTRENADIMAHSTGAGWCSGDIRALSVKNIIAKYRSCDRCGKVNHAEIHTCSPEYQKMTAALSQEKANG